MRALSKLQDWFSGSAWLYLAVFAVLANIPVWVGAGSRIVVVSGWFNLDLLVVGVIALFLPRAVSAVILFGAITADFVSCICLTYYITPPELMQNAFEAVSMPASRLALLCALTLLSLAVSLAVFLLPRPRRRIPIVILLVGCAVFCAVSNEWELYAGSSSRWKGVLLHPLPDTVDVAYLRHIRPARTPILELFTLKREESGSAGRAGGDPAPAENAAAIAMRSVTARGPAGHRLPDLVLVVVESWGQSLDQGLREALVQPYEANLAGKFNIVRGSVPFHGATISGENRELCGSAGGASIITESADDLRGCLPNELRALGFETLAVHGMDGHFYHRKKWYPRVGFEESLFDPELESRGLPDCPGAFTGTCDAAIAGLIGEKLSQPDPRPRFVYWVTLNSHLPVPNPPPLNPLAPCDLTPTLADQAALCNWYRLLLNVHQSIAGMAARSSRPTVYAVVGDHAPPFAEPGIRSGFDQNVVPYLILVPRQVPDPVPPPSRAAIPVVPDRFKAGN